jgi:hypothetical protein
MKHDPIVANPLGARLPAWDAEARAYAEFYGDAARVMVARGDAFGARVYAELAASYAAEVVTS